MNTSTENIRLWMDQSEPDYYLFFLKAWIPFNAWYVAEYPDLKKRDTEIIKALQDNADSRPRRIIHNLLSNNANHESLRFKSFFAELHFQLEKNPVFHNGSRLSFLTLALTENPVKHSSHVDANGFVYKVERTASFSQAYIEAKGGKVILDVKMPKYKADDLLMDINYIKLDKSTKKIICKLFKEIDPLKPISIISSSNSSGASVRIQSLNPCKIINDMETVAKGCIRVLYSLRCMLFHGEISPNEANRRIYENAFYILQMTVNKLK
ncbi:hypothetical protein [Hymenobacter sp. APR13]|uniref:hypothetical protein n=1 Tax=Hymenobacter sp. APR13 TaxID=1356852 RepID=UPI0012E049EA|nr:hypothetical protein [Hymenobacter sp. APR13]